MHPVFRTAYNAALGFEKPKWIHFCEIMKNKGFEVSVYEARRTVSKYVTVKLDTQSFKVRFSNHAPIPGREQKGDCDFFVGRCNFGTTTTAQAVLAVINYFGCVSL